MLALEQWLIYGLEQFGYNVSQNIIIILFLNYLIGFYFQKWETKKTDIRWCLSLHQTRELSLFSRSWSHPLHHFKSKFGISWPQERTRWTYFSKQRCINILYSNITLLTFINRVSIHNASTAQTWQKKINVFKGLKWSLVSFLTNILAVGCHSQNLKIEWNQFQ